MDSYNFSAHGGDGPLSTGVRASGYLAGASSWIVGEDLHWGHRRRGTVERRSSAGWRAPPIARRCSHAPSGNIGVGVTMGSLARRQRRQRRYLHRRVRPPPLRLPSPPASLPPVLGVEQGTRRLAIQQRVRTAAGKSDAVSKKRVVRLKQALGARLCAPSSALIVPRVPPRSRCTTSRHRLCPGLCRPRRRLELRGRRRGGGGAEPDLQLESTITCLINKEKVEGRFALRPLQRQPPAGRPRPLTGHGPGRLLRAHLARRPDLHRPDHQQRLPSRRPALARGREPLLGHRLPEHPGGMVDLDGSPRTAPTCCAGASASSGYRRSGAPPDDATDPDGITVSSEYGFRHRQAGAPAVRRQRAQAVKRRD